MCSPLTHGVLEEFFEIGWLKHLHNEHQRTHGRSRHQDPSLELKSDHQRWLGSWLKRVMSAWKWSGCAVGLRAFKVWGGRQLRKLKVGRYGEWEMGEFVTYIDGKSWKGLIICFLKVIMFTIGGPHKQWIKSFFFASVHVGIVWQVPTSSQ